MFLTEDRLDQIIDLPVALPAAKLQPLDWILVSTVEIQLPQVIKLNQLQLHILEIEAEDSTDPCGGTSKHAINPEFPSGSLACVFFAKNPSHDTRPDLQPYVELLAAPTDFENASTATAPIFVSRFGKTEISVSEEGQYSLYVLNNTTNRKIVVSLNGILTIDLAPA